LVNGVKEEKDGEGKKFREKARNPTNYGLMALQFRTLSFVLKLFAMRSLLGSLPSFI